MDASAIVLLLFNAYFLIERGDISIFTGLIRQNSEKKLNSAAIVPHQLGLLTVA